MALKTRRRIWVIYGFSHGRWHEISARLYSSGATFLVACERGGGEWQHVCAVPFEMMKGWGEQ